MDWSYVAGFFDGEGNIWTGRYKHAPNSRAIHIAISQAESNARPIRVLAGFLRAHQIRFSVGWTPPVLRKQRQLRLRITDHRAARDFLSRLIPYLILKKRSAERAIKLIDSKPWRLKRHPTKAIREAYSLYRTGASVRDIRKVAGINERTLIDGWKKMGLKRRTQSEAALLWRKHRATHVQSRG